MLNTHKTIPIGKVNILKYWGNTSSRKSYQLNVTLYLEQDMCNTIRPVAYASITDDNGDTILLTHDLSELKDVPELKANTTFNHILLLVTEYAHGIHAGTPEQTYAVRKGYATGEYPSLNYQKDGQKHCEYLKSQNLYDTKQSDGSWYRYGHGWANGKQVPSSHLMILKTLMGWP